MVEGFNLSAEIPKSGEAKNKHTSQTNGFKIFKTSKINSVAENTKISASKISKALVLEITALL